MKSKRKIIKKYATILTLAVTTIVFLPETLLAAKGAVVGYVWGDRNVTDDHLDRMTHIMATDMYINASNNLIPNPDLPPNWVSSWLDPLVKKHTVRVSE